MKRHLSFLLVFLIGAVSMFAKPAVREIPGITGKDTYVRGCIDCHTGKNGMPAPLSTIIKTWSGKIDATTLAQLQAFAPKDMKLKGKHPPVPVKDVPVGCFRCHATSKSAPPLPRMMHGIHLTGGESSPFLTKFGGECTHCHKLDLTTARWTLPMASER